VARIEVRGSLRGKRGAVVAIALCAVAVALAGVPAQARADRSDRLLELFNASIADAAVYRHDNLRKLRPLRFDPATDTALVTTLTGDRYATGGQTLEEEVWVSGVPEIRRLCRRAARRLEGPQLKLFLRQLLGLHPNSYVRRFVTFEVARPNVFRPTADPDPTTRWPCPKPRARSCGLRFPAGVPQSHVTWMADQMLDAWVVASPLSVDGYPWTRLGYTYNWRPGADRYGGSEYVLRPGSFVNVTSVERYAPYCGARPRPDR
jgi:hypothetical protein